MRLTFPGTSMPRTTVWRSVRRLEDLGLVRITKVEGKNMVTLIRDLQP
ncbi:hypothetical protein [Vulcanisaeta distributa]|nr:hypothetical protein [Vulcanisaeta distributa]